MIYAIHTRTKVAMEAALCTIHEVEKELKSFVAAQEESDVTDDWYDDEWPLDEDDEAECDDWFDYFPLKLNP